MGTVKNRAVFLGVVLALGGILLTGCDSFGVNPMALRMSPNDTVLVLVCEPLEVANVSLSLRDDDGLKEVDLTPRVPISLRALGVLDLSDARFSSTRMPGVEGVSEIGVVLDSDADGTGPYQITSFKVPSAGIPAEGWLRPDGTTGSDPCPGRPKTGL